MIFDSLYISTVVHDISS